VKRRQARRRNAASNGPARLARRTGLRIAEARRLAAASLRPAPPEGNHGRQARAGAPHGASPRHLSSSGSALAGRRTGGGAAGRSRDPRLPGHGLRGNAAPVWKPRRCGTWGLIAPVPSGGRGCAPSRRFLIARLAMLLAQRSPPAQWRTKGPKGRVSRRRPCALAGKAATQGNRPSAPSPAPPDDASRGQKVGQGCGRRGRWG
jgi:hypothetical protein